MSKKITAYGNQNITPVRVPIRITYTDGSMFNSSVSAASPYSRRFGSSGTITSSSGNDGVFRPVSHSKAKYLALPLSDLPPRCEANYLKSPINSSTIWKQTYHGIFEDAHARRSSNFNSACDSVNLSVATLQWSSLAANAVQQMLPSFHTRNSLVNFLLELKDFRSVVKYAFGNLQKKVSLVQALTGTTRSDKTLARLSKGYLSYQFGWKPLVNDLASFFSTITGFTRRYEELIRRSGSPQQSYYGVWVSGTEQPETEYYSNGVGNGPAGWIGSFQPKIRVRAVLGETKGVRYHATIRYRYRMPDELRSVHGKLKAFLDTLGLAPNPATIWNAIPFSFLIDWIVNVSSYLDRLRVDNVNFQTEILDFCHSGRIERNIYLKLAGENYVYPYGYMPSAYYVTDTCQKTVYERKVGLPNFLTAIQSSGLNPREILLGGALVGARTGRR